MSKMDRILNSKKDKETIYEIYRACRLCGAGAGYKMPIIQSVVDLDDSDIELKQKIRECVQIEVHQDDKMPPLICELCVDKVNDFYEFLEMCRQTNKKTRLRLGLPPQSMPRGALDAGECILGLTEPVYVNDDSDGEPLAKHKKLQPRVKVKKEPELKVKIEKKVLTDTRSSRFKSNRRPPTPPRITRHRANSKDENVSLSRLQDKSKSSKVIPKSILKKDTKTEDNSLLTPRLKRSRDKEPVKLDTPVKRVKLAVKTSPAHSTPKLPPKTSPRVAKLTKSPKISSKRPSSPPRSHKCSVCGLSLKTMQASISHMRSHGVSFTTPRLACNPCGLWFLSGEEASSHHKHHRSKSNPYTCRRCDANFKHLSAYDEHFDNNQCIPLEEVPDVKCEVCWHMFPTNKLLNDHKCLGEHHRPGGKCSKCNKRIMLMRNLIKHEQNCTAKRRGELIVDPVLLGKLRPIQVRVSRCDPLLTNIKQEHYDVSSVSANFGLDKNCVYPYISSVSSLRIKSEPDELDSMVAIKDEIKQEFYTEEDYVHWDSEDTESDEENGSCSLVLNHFVKKKKIDTLANLSLKILFSRRCLGRVPKKRRRVKREDNLFDSLLANETEDDVTKNINSIIDNLGDDDDEESNRKGDDIRVKDKDVGVDDVTDSINVSDDKINDVVKESVDDSKDSVVDSKNDVVDKSDDIDKEAVITDDKDSQNEDVDSKEASQENTIDDTSLPVSVVSTDKNDSQYDVDASEKVDSVDTADKIDDVDKNNKIDAVGDLQVLKQEENDNNSAADDGNSVCNDTTDSTNNLSNNSNDDSSKIDDKLKINNGPINNISVGGVASCKNDIDSNFKFTEISKEENRSYDDNEIDNSSAKNYIDDVSLNNYDNQDSNSVGTLNDNTQSDVTSDNDKESIDKVIIDVSDNATSLPEQNSEVDDNKSQEEFSLDLSQSSKISEVDINILDSSDRRCQVNEKSETRQVNEITDSDYKKVTSVIVNSGKTKNLTDSEEMDDTKLMEALDAEIGESNENSSNQVNDNFNDKIALEDLITTKGTEIDNIIPEEFNFDA